MWISIGILLFLVYRFSFCFCSQDAPYHPAQTNFRNLVFQYLGKIQIFGKSWKLTSIALKAFSTWRTEDLSPLPVGDAVGLASLFLVGSMFYNPCSKITLAIKAAHIHTYTRTQNSLKYVWKCFLLNHNLSVLKTRPIARTQTNWTPLFYWTRIILFAAKEIQLKRL